MLIGCSVVVAAPQSELWDRWQKHDPSSKAQVNHDLWNEFLKTYVAVDDPSGINMVAYGAVTDEDRRLMETYLEYLQRVRISGYARTEQLAFWINLYNAATVKLILDHYPVKSIRNINISPGLLRRGPWDARLLRVEGEAVSLNDIEHRILRPIWKDARIHYAVNCASIGCPNLQPRAYTAENTEGLLNRGAKEYVNHERGVNVEDGRMRLSSIYDWFQDDFGDSEEDVIEHLLKFAGAGLAQEIESRTGRIRYAYDWNLNE